MDGETAIGAMIGAALLFGLIGIAVATVLISLGVIKKEDPGGELFK